MKVTDLTVTKLKHGYWHVECEVLALGNPVLKRLDHWEYETTDLITVRAICLGYMRPEAFNVVKKEQWLHRCRTARPGSVVLSLRWDGASGESHPAVPRKWSVTVIRDEDLEIDLSYESPTHVSEAKWHDLPFADPEWLKWALSEEYGQG